MAAPNDCIPYKEPGLTLSAKASAAITGKRFVKITAPRTGGGVGGLSADVVNLPVVGPCTATTDVALGVASNDCPINGVFKVFEVGNGIILPITAGATLTAGIEVQTDATGQAIPVATGKALGLTIDAAASGADAEIKLY